MHAEVVFRVWSAAGAFGVSGDPQEIAKAVMIQRWLNIESL